MRKILTLLLTASMAAAFAQQPYDLAPTRKVRVALKIENPPVSWKGNKRIHELFNWGDPMKYSEALRDSLTAASGGVAQYEFTYIYDDTAMFTLMQGKRLSLDSLVKLLYEPGWATFQTKTTQHDYLGVLDYYDLCEKSDSGLIDEVWIYSFPYGGGWESTLAGQFAFWCNSPPLTGSSCVDILPIMVYNYERGVAEAMHSMSHRVEYTMKQVFGRWLNEPYSSGTVTSSLNSWEKFSSTEKKNPGKSHVGTCHYPPNATKDYDYDNSSNTVTSYYQGWDTYPNLAPGSKQINCSEWDCNHLGFMSWWFRKIPKFVCTNEYRLNNWWHYLYDYEGAIELADSLSLEPCTPNSINKHRPFMAPQILPNPANQYIFFNNANQLSNIAIYDLTGKLLIYVKLNNNSANYRVDVSSLTDGFYLVETEDELGELHREKIIIAN